VIINHITNASKMVRIFILTGFKR